MRQELTPHMLEILNAAGYTFGLEPSDLNGWRFDKPGDLVVTVTRHLFTKKED